MVLRCAAAFLFLLLAAGHAWAGISANCVQTPPAGDKANAVVSGSFTATGVSPCFAVRGTFNVFIYGNSGPNGSWTGSVQLERSVNGGTTWIIAGTLSVGVQAVYNTPNQDVSVEAIEPEAGVIYQLHCTVFTSGPINYRMSTTGGTGTQLP